MTSAEKPSFEYRSGLPETTLGGAEPVFSAPWQAAAFAMTLALHERGLVTWTEWAAYLNRAILDAQASGDPDHGDTYYVHWLTALERIATAKGWVTTDALLKCRNAWDEAARRTPHGKRIELR
ncbi:putative Nitrile hydratase accessory protein [Burkholderia sp. lig30]|jgi:nitrile hydratase accessory protein|uniref:nitrile hydratase accessory protein n=1 Tax=Burkholderia sp. lig30 TaxID=1192124 RepID=UPI000461AAA9|nr:nitrile hydratase accessory protein [Burkholderia sp. lig30]KDB08244.1 putative Nitrile hydratase accessory protein [Burkholderia sp. lig30]